jgi:hypothetical protein
MEQRTISQGAHLESNIIIIIKIIKHNLQYLIEANLLVMPNLLDKVNASKTAIFSCRQTTTTLNMIKCNLVDVTQYNYIISLL